MIREEVYEPREDSYLLQKYVEKYSKGCELVLDMGTGTGIQAVTASKNSGFVLACDINLNAAEHLKEEIKKNKINNIEVFCSDLFEFLHGKYFDVKSRRIVKSTKKNKFDLMVFNPPYLIKEYRITDFAIFGGKRGYETTGRFINECSDFLKDDGKVLITGSSLVNNDKLKEIIDNNLLEAGKLESQHFFFEDVFILLIRKSGMLKRLNKLGISGIRFFSQGKRGRIFTGYIGKKKAGIKIKRAGSTALNTVSNEIRILKILNKEGIGPELLLYGDDFLAYSFVEGKFILDFIQDADRNSIIDVVKEVFRQCSAMDRLGINKFEMQHPVKHIIVGEKTVLIDFERARFSPNPKNVTQFCDFLIRIRKHLGEKDITVDKNRLIRLAKGYKEDMDINKIFSVFN